ncbi:DUF5949 family protein [Streptomyces sp. BI20]|uniref:DUF5949 family protein n=1 Tax=Streptomyces sp. BI20 TaxID=3403460 RepID=UPI003C795DFB
MTSTQAEIDSSRLGTLSVLAWIGDPEEGHDIPYLLAYTLGDGPGEPEEALRASEEAARALLDQMKLTIGDVVLDATHSPRTFPIQVVLVDDQVALTMPGLNAQCGAPPEWVAAANDSEQVYFLFATRPWPEAAPGKPVSPEALQKFAGDEEVLTSAAHCVLQVQRLQR